ncbi:hypothetical protein FGRMN_9037 [Fusarium graminum]|nr:hypothetical protein FGRMN_9037 [Fusarium graminum]
MLSFKHHALYWVLSLLTVPLAELREFFVYYGLFPDIINDVHFPLLCLTVYILMRYTLGLQEEKLREDKEGVISTFSGNVIAANLDEPSEEERNVEAQRSKRTNVNGNANGRLNDNANGNVNGREARKRKGKAKQKKKQKKRFARGPNGGPREVQRSQNENARQYNRNGTPQNSLPIPPSVDPRQFAKSSAAKKKPAPWAVVLLCNHFLVLYFLGLILLCTQKDWTPGFSEYIEGPYTLWSARVLMTFVVLGTLEPIRLDRWDVQVCGLGMFSNDLIFDSRGPGPYTSVLLGVGGLAIMGGIIEVGFYMVLGQWSWWPALWFEGAATISDTWIRIQLLIPLIDVVETTLYAIFRHTHREWYNRRRELVQRPV